LTPAGIRTHDHGACSSPQENQFTDVTLLVGDVTFYAHRMVLYDTLTYFRNLQDRLGHKINPVASL
jgi:hypothetical protein